MFVFLLMRNIGPYVYRFVRLWQDCRLVLLSACTLQARIGEAEPGAVLRDSAAGIWDRRGEAHRPSGGVGVMRPQATAGFFFLGKQKLCSQGLVADEVGPTQNGWYHRLCLESNGHGLGSCGQNPFTANL